MEITAVTYLIVCPMLFLAGLIDAIGGGGGLISLPAYLIAGLPPHTAVATNKMSSSCGTALATYRFIRAGMVKWKLAIPAVFAAIAGSSIGANLSLLVDEKILMTVLLIMLPVVAFVVMNKKTFKDREETEIILSKKLYLIVTAAAFVVGCYDGFYGPGTGTFLIIAFSVLGGLGLKSANGLTKVINLTSNITSLVIFILNGEVLFVVGIAAAVCNMIGGYIGAGLMMKNGAKIVKPSILLVLCLLVVKLISELFVS